MNWTYTTLKSAIQDYVESADSKGTSTEKKGRKSKKENAEVSK